MYANALRRTVFTLIGLVAASTASAGTITTWSGTGANNNWGTAGNWTTTPTNSGTFSLVFSGTPTRTTSVNNIGGATATVSVDSILYANDGSAGQSAAIRLNTSSSRFITLVNGATVTTTAVTTGTLSETIASPLTLSGSSTFNIASRHDVTLSGAVSGGSIVKTGVGELYLTGSNSLTGLSVLNGLVSIDTTALSGIAGTQVALGSVGNSAVLRFNAVSGTTSAAFLVRGDATITPQLSNVTFSSGTFNVADPTATGTSVLTLAGGANGNNGTQTVNGRIQDNVSGTVALTIGTANTQNVWVLKGDNTYTGATTLLAGGRLLMDGVVSGSSTTTSSGYVGGTGTFGGHVSILSGTLAPGGTSTSGVITDSIGKLTVGSLSLSAPATTAMTITGSTAGLFDQIAVSGGSMTYGGILALTLSGSYVNFTSFDLFSGIVNPSGNLSDITLSAGGSPYADLDFSDYANTSQLVRNEFNMTDGDWITDANSSNQRLIFSRSTGTLTVVPEPSTIVFAGIGLAMFGWSTWTRRRARARRQVIEAAIA